MIFKKHVVNNDDYITHNYYTKFFYHFGQAVDHFYIPETSSMISWLVGVEGYLSQRLVLLVVAMASS